jgi:undecaprenyl pyrophosphate phosphatase UppP
MLPHTLAFLYGGPDQIIPLQTGLAALLAVALMFWHKLVATFHRLFSHSESELQQIPSADTTIEANGGQGRDQT